MSVSPRAASGVTAAGQGPIALRRGAVIDRTRAADRAAGVEFDDVLGAARNGAEWAWEGIYTRLAPVVRGYLRGQCAPSPDDIVSEVFLQVVRDLHRFEGTETQFRSWVFTIAHHRLLDARRYAARRPVEPVLPETIEAVMPAAPEDPVADVLTSMATEDVHRLTASLTDDQRAALLLRVVGGLTISEIAEVMDRRPGAVKQLQRRAIVTLRARLGAHPYPTDDMRALTHVT